MPFLRISEGRGNSIDDYLGRLTRLIPAPALGIYLTAKNFIPVEHIGWWALTCAVVVILFSILGTHDEKKKPKVQVGAVVVSLIAYVIWIYALGDHIAVFELRSPWLASVAVILWSGLIPLIYKGDPGGAHGGAQAG